jgi:hypothetical protein
VDMTLVIVGIALTIYGLVMLLAYLWLERGSFLDPVAVSWAGYLLFIPIAMICTGALYPERETASVSLMGCVLMVLGTLTYTLGLYCGKAIRFSRRLPRPRPTISKAQIWIALLISIAMIPIFPLLMPWLVEVAGGSAGTVLYDTMFSVTLIGVIGLVMMRGSPISRILMGAVAIVACVAILWTIWSRRPLAGVLIATVGLFYHFRIAGRSTITKLWYFGGLSTAVLFLVVYLDATRGERFYDRARALPTFSAQNLEGVLAGVEMNYRVYELALQKFPTEHPYLYGSGYVPGICWFPPRAMWPSKPVSTGYVLSQIWWNVDVVASSVGLPPMGEAYANFGIFGLLVILFVIGRVVRILNSYLQIHYDNVIAWAAWLMVVPDVATEWRGDFTSMTAQALLRVIGFLAVMWVSGWLSPRPNARLTPQRRAIPSGGRQPLSWNGVQPLALRQQRRIVKRA